MHPSALAPGRSVKTYDSVSLQVFLSGPLVCLRLELSEFPLLRHAPPGLDLREAFWLPLLDDPVADRRGQVSKVIGQGPICSLGCPRE